MNISTSEEILTIKDCDERRIDAVTCCRNELIT